MATLLSDTFPSRCEAAKQRAAGKLARKELYCHATAAAKGLPVDAACIEVVARHRDRRGNSKRDCPQSVRQGRLLDSHR